MLAAVVGAEDHSMLGPGDDRVVELEPGHPEDDWKVAEARGVELDDLGMRADVELDRESFMGDEDGASVEGFHVS